VRERVAALGLADVIVCHGVVSRDEMDRAYREADLFLIPSFGEGFPNSMLEAMRHALPVIGAPVGAIPEVIDTNGGVLVAADDAAGLARAALRLAGDPGLRAAMGAHNREVVRARYALDVVFARFDTLWADAIAEGRRR
jgi:glycosyltransferase involved in cell wall biosynthesis